MNKLKWTLALLVLTLATPAAMAYQGDMARSLQQVRTIWVNADVCPLGISEELEQHGFQVVSNRRHADAILEVDVNTNGRYADHNSVEKARYSASLIGNNNRVLFRTAGKERAHDLDNLCEDVGNEIADSLENVIKS